MIRPRSQCNNYMSAAAKYQDSKYGKGNRVFNKTQKGFKCTVCGNTVSK